MQSISTANRSVLDAVAKQFDLSDARLQEISKKFVNELRLGLAQDSAGGLPMM
jgi:hexokinase